MKKTAEQMLKVEKFDEEFPIVRASTLSCNEEFLKHKPESIRQERLRKSIFIGIGEGLNDFRRPAMDPSFDKDGNYIYKAGEKPAVGKTILYSYAKLKEFMPQKNSRMGNLRQYDAFLGLLIKYLIYEKGYEVSEAWKMVCDRSKELGHYCDSKGYKYDFEATGSRKVWMFYDLANTSKIIENRNSISGFSLAGASFGDYSDRYPLASIDNHYYTNIAYNTAVPWLVMDV